jgi:hypothetical protein
MKNKTTTLLFLMIFIFSCEKTVDSSQIVKKEDSKYYLKETDQLFTGKFEKISDDGSKKFVAEMKEGVFWGSPKYYLDDKELENDSGYQLENAAYSQGELKILFSKKNWYDYYEAKNSNQSYLDWFAELSRPLDDTDNWLGQVAMARTLENEQENLYRSLFDTFLSFYKKEVEMSGYVFCYRWSEAMGYTSGSGKFCFYDDRAVTINKVYSSTGKATLSAMSQSASAWGSYYFARRSNKWEDSDLEKTLTNNLPPYYKILKDENGEYYGDGDDIILVGMDIDESTGNFSHHFPGSNPDRKFIKLTEFLNLWKDFSGLKDEHINEVVAMHNKIFDQKSIIEMRSEKHEKIYSELLTEASIVWCEISNRYHSKRIPDFNEHFWDKS